MLYNPLLEPINTYVTIRTPCLSTPPYTPHDSQPSLNTPFGPPENSNITNVSKASRKCVQFMFLYIIHSPLLQLKSVGKKCGLYTVKDSTNDMRNKNEMQIQHI